MLCRKFADECDDKWTAEELLDLSRLWKLEGGDTIEDVKQMLSEINNDLNKLPLAVQARVLEPSQMIDEINVADQELIVMEFKISFDKNAACSWVYAP